MSKIVPYKYSKKCHVERLSSHIKHVEIPISCYRKSNESVYFLFFLSDIFMQFPAPNNAVAARNTMNEIAQITPEHNCI